MTQKHYTQITEVAFAETLKYMASCSCGWNLREQHEISARVLAAMHKQSREDPAYANIVAQDSFLSERLARDTPPAQKSEQATEGGEEDA